MQAIKELEAKGYKFSAGDGGIRYEGPAGELQDAQSVRRRLEEIEANKPDALRYLILRQANGDDLVTHAQTLARTIYAERTQEDAYRLKSPEEHARFVVDPRPDLEEDRKRWRHLLARAYLDDPKVHRMLHVLRCGGAELIFEDGELSMKPRFGEGMEWEDEEEWEDDLKMLLGSVGDRVGKVKKREEELLQDR